MLFDSLLSLVAPHECLGCSAEGKLVCANCTASFTPVPLACYRCRALSDGAKTCVSCRASSDLFAVRAGAVYKGAAKDLVWHLKFQGAQAAANEIADYLIRTTPISAQYCIVPVPTASSRIRQRGYDQATLIAKALAAKSGAMYLPVLRRSGQHHQVGSSRAQRKTQLQSAYHCVRPRALAGRHILLIDDVLTTGATLEAAAHCLKQAGAQRVSGLVFARA